MPSHKNQKALSWLSDWFCNQCYGDLEQEYGITISYLNNPGWKISISLKGTNLEKKDMQSISIGRSELDWIHCFKDNGCFEVVRGIKNLDEGLWLFRRWIESLVDTWMDRYW